MGKGEDGVVLNKRAAYNMLGIELSDVYDYKGSGTFAGYTIYGDGVAEDGIKLVNVKAEREQVGVRHPATDVVTGEDDIVSKSAVTKAEFVEKINELPRDPTLSLEMLGAKLGSL